MWRAQNNKSGFSIVVAILMSAFLIVLSMGVLDLILGERRITRVVYNTISTYAGAEGAMELALLKIKNHRDGFSDVIDLEGHSDMQYVLTQSQNSANRSEQRIGYEMETRSKPGESYSGTGVANEFVIIPLYYDKEADVIRHNESVVLEKTKDLKVTVSDPDNVVWNIIGNDSSGHTVGLVGKGEINSASTGTKKTVSTTCDVEGNCDLRIEEGISVDAFLTSSDHADNYLILFSDGDFSYSVLSSNGFSLPKSSIVATGQIGDFMQSISFSEDKSRLFDALKYSVFSE